MSDHFGDDGAEILEESGTADSSDNPNSLPLTSTSPVIKGMTGVLPQPSEFPSKCPAQINHFINQDDYLIDERYDSEGDLLYYSNELLSQELDYEYDKCPIQEEEDNKNPPPNDDPSQNNHDFMEQVGFALINPDKYWPCKKSPQELIAKNKHNNSSTPKAPKFDTNALCPENGQLKNRLDSTLGHMPTPAAVNSKNSGCQLHQWAHKPKTGEHKLLPGLRVHVMHCKECKVNICLCCWEIYHTENDLSQKIDQILSFK